MITSHTATIDGLAATIATAVVPDAARTEAAELAWSDEIFDRDFGPTEAAELAWSDEILDRDFGPTESWGMTWGHALVFLSIGALAAFVIGVVGWVLVNPNSRSSAPDHPEFVAPPTVADSLRAPESAAAPTPSAAVPEPETATAEYVALAFGLVNHAVTYGVAGTQESADNIALAQCRSRGDATCVVTSRSHLGCAAVAISAKGDFSGASGPDTATARASALKGLRSTTPIGGGTWCSDPPGSGGN